MSRKTSLMGFVTTTLLLSNCMGIAKSLANQPYAGYGLEEELVGVMGCDLEDVISRGKEYKRQSFAAGGPGYVVPSVGDTGCDVLAKLGRPDDYDTVETETDGHLNFWYRTGSTQTRDLKMHLVVMAENENGSGMVVIRVGW